MSETQAKKTVLVSMLVLAAIAVYRGKSPADVGMYKRIWAAGVVGVFLSLTADFAPSLAGPFALLTVLGSLSSGGDKAILNLLGGANSTGSGSSGTSSTTVKRTGPHTTETTTRSGDTVTHTTATGP